MRFPERQLAIREHWSPAYGLSARNSGVRCSRLVRSTGTISHSIPVPTAQSGPSADWVTENSTVSLLASSINKGFYEDNWHLNLLSQFRLTTVWFRFINTTNEQVPSGHSRKLFSQFCPSDELASTISGSGSLSSISIDSHFVINCMNRLPLRPPSA